MFNVSSSITFFQDLNGFSKRQNEMKFPTIKRKIRKQDYSGIHLFNQ